MTDFSDNALGFTLRIEGDSVTMSSATGQSYTAKLDGTGAPYKGDPGINNVSMLRLGEHTLMETDKRGTMAVRSVRIMMVPGSNRIIDLIVTDMVRGRSALYVGDKQ